MKNIKNTKVSGPYEKVNAATRKSMEAREALKVASDEAFDVAVELGWELGIIDERGRVREIINALKQSLTDDEEKALQTLDIVLTLVLDYDEDETKENNV
jgi:hypothetical protein